MLNYRDIAKIFEEIEIMLISSLKRNIASHKNTEQQYGSRWSSWQAEKLRNIDKFRQENLRIMNYYTNIIDSSTRQIMLDEFAQGVNGINTAVPENIPEIPAEIVKEPHFFGVDNTKIDKLMVDVVTLEKHVEVAVLRTIDDVYRQTVNKAQLAMSTGTPLQKAIDMAMQDFLSKGINCIVYRDGRRVNVADYVRMALRTTAKRSALYGESARVRRLGYDTVQVDSYGMCSDTCLPWQGRVYIDDVFSLWDGEIQERSDSGLWGKSHYCGKWFPLLSNALHGGLFHPNCRHTIRMWRDGDSIPEPMDNSEIQRRYKLEQHQRQLENKVRKARRFAVGQSDPANVKKAKKLLRDAEKELREFINNTNINECAIILKRDYGKTEIYTANSQNSLTSVVNSGTIKVPETLSRYEKAKDAYMEKIKNTEIMKPENKEAVEKTLKTLIDKGDFCMRIEENTLENIIDSEDKRFKTQMETGTSGGAYNPDLRKKATEILFGADSSKVPDTAFEKYGFLAGKDKSITFADGEGADYGKIIIQFDKNTLFNRTTFTVGDSLNGIEGGSLFAGKVSEPSVCAVPQDNFTNKTIEASKKFNIGSIKNHIEFCHDAMVDYIELQYHGELLLDDVEIIYYYENIHDNLKSKLEKSGIKVQKVER